MLLGLLILYGISNCVINYYVNCKVGSRSGRGIPSIAWVAMGLQDNGETGPGWYNNYIVDVYEDSQYDSSITKSVAQEDIEKSLKYLTGDISAGMTFFYRKIASEWNEPTFQSLWINNKLRNRAEDMPQCVQNFFDGQNEASKVYTLVYESFLFLLWAGIIIFLYSERKNENITNLIWMIIFIGGFLFHLFWEAKGQYTLIYVWLCIPYGVRGYYLLCHCVRSRILTRTRSNLIVMRSEQEKIRLLHFSRRDYLHNGKEGRFLF